MTIFIRVPDLARPAYYLDVDTFHLVAPEALAAQVGLDIIDELVILKVPECIVDGIVQVDVPGRVHVEIHLVVRTESS